MKKTLVVLLIAVSSVAAAENLRLQDGTVYKNVIIIGADPERMLIVHDGGGCQVDFATLVPDSLTEAQREAVAQALRDYTARTIKQEELKQQKAAQRLEEARFAESQREKGLILFEDSWMTPADRQEIMALRELNRLEMEQKELELAKQKAAYEKELRLAEQERLALEEQRNRTTYVYTTYPTYSRYPTYCKPTHRTGKSRYSYQGSYSSGHGGISISYSSGKTTPRYSGNNSGAWCKTTRSRRR